MWSLVTLIPAGALALSDFRHRTVSAAWLAVFGMLAAGSVVLADGWMAMLARSGSNLLLLGVLGGCVGLWLLLRGRVSGLRLRDYAGAGDLVFAVLLTPLFDLRGYLIFLLAGSAGSLVWWLAATRITGRPATIPLVGTLGIAYILYTLYLIVA